MVSRRGMVDRISYCFGPPLFHVQQSSEEANRQDISVGQTILRYILSWKKPSQIHQRESFRGFPKPQYFVYHHRIHVCHSC